MIDFDKLPDVEEDVAGFGPVTASGTRSSAQLGFMTLGNGAMWREMVTLHLDENRQMRRFEGQEITLTLSEARGLALALVALLKKQDAQKNERISKMAGFVREARESMPPHEADVLQTISWAIASHLVEQGVALPDEEADDT